ncbi:gluconokinase [Pseudoxanthomonas sp. GM95]|uniref:gluconokinase n=1 Tax=Pseudoxanthomonas sp. GM95 TaxID=1881043 RepID=UPI0008BF6F36|nr:gluconokinase [Pseudoxanthomonas sp. GM95]SEL84382.1 gluconokinase [Pseudoxanthomonas sp. GM95]
MNTPKTLVVMGVSASGKTTVSNVLGAELDCRVLDADDLHPPENVEKMREGIALTDVDRLPWLKKVAAWIADQKAAGVGAVVSCSALKRRYRDVLREADPALCFIWLDVDRQTLEARLKHRRGHFMPASLLDDQLATLEPPDADECAVRVVPQDTVDATVADALAGLAELR